MFSSINSVCFNDFVSILISTLLVREDKQHILVVFVQRTTNLMPLPRLLAYIEAGKVRLRLRRQAAVVSSIEPNIIEFTQPVQPLLSGFEQPVLEATTPEPVLVCGPPGHSEFEPSTSNNFQPLQKSAQSPSNPPRGGESNS